MSNVSNDVAMWLNSLAREKTETLSLFSLEFNRLKKLAPVEAVRVIKTPNGEPRLFFIDRLKTIQLLKSLYAFQTKEEASNELHLES